MVVAALSEQVVRACLAPDDVLAFPGAYGFDGGVGGDGIDYETRSEAYQRLVRELLEAQREVLIAMRDGGEINDEMLRRLERELDLEDSRLEI